jgi:hypothetical protein
MSNPPDNCPVCGAEVPPRARACPECGADEQTGWSEKARYNELGIPDDSFDYDKFVAEEFGQKKARRKNHWLWFAAALLVLFAFFLAFVRR